MIPIIVINWNGYEDTVECMSSVLLLDHADFHVHLIDNGSANQEGLRLKTLFQNENRVTIHLYDSNYGFSGAHLKIWNERLKNDPSISYIALLNNDTVVEPGWLTALASMARKKKCGIVASKMIYYYNRRLMDNAGHKMLNTGEILPIGHREEVLNYVDAFENMGGCGGAVLYSAEMLRAIGFFDDYFSTGYEDAELGLRAICAGYTSWYCPNAVVYHKEGQSIKKIFNSDYALMIQSAILYSYFKNMPTWTMIRAVPSFLLKYSAMIVIDIVFMRWTYLKILIRSWLLLFNNRRLIHIKRKMRDHPITKDVSHRLEWFLPFDIKRFWSLIIIKRESALDKY